MEVCIHFVKVNHEVITQHAHWRCVCRGGGLEVNSRSGGTRRAARQVRFIIAVIVVRIGQSWHFVVVIAVLVCCWLWLVVAACLWLIICRWQWGVCIDVSVDVPNLPIIINHASHDRASRLVCNCRCRFVCNCRTVTRVPSCRTARRLRDDHDALLDVMLQIFASTAKTPIALHVRCILVHGESISSVRAGLLLAYDSQWRIEFFQSFDILSAKFLAIE